MTIILKEVDAVCIGVGFTGSILARELTKAGLKVVGLERGANRSPREDFALPSVRDDLKYAVRQELFQDTQLETVSLRHTPGRDRAADPPARLVPARHRRRRRRRALERRDLAAVADRPQSAQPSQDRYGSNAVPAEMTIEDFPVSYDELEPYYDRFEKLLGVSGKAGNLRGQKIDGGNVFEGPRQNDYPNKPLAMSMAGAIMEKAARELGYHPFRAPAANMSEAYTNPEGVTLGACEYCGHCERFGCEANAKSSPQSCILPVLLADDRFELRTHANVKELVYDRQAKKVKAVRYVDLRSGEEYEQPAGIVILGAYVFNNDLLMMQAGIGEQYDPVTGKGALGRNYCYQVSGNNVTVFFEDKEINPFMAAGALVRHEHRRFQRRQFRPFGSWLLRRRLDLAPAPRTAGRSRPGRCRPARRAGAAIGRRRPPSGTTTPSTSARRDATTPTAKTISISIRPIGTRSAARWCA